MYLTLSPKFTIRNEKNCSFLFPVDNGIETNSSKMMPQLMPPIIGYILSKIGNYPLELAYKKLSEEIGVSEESIKVFVENIRCPENKKFPVNDSEIIIFPYDLLMESEEKGKDIKIPNDFSPTDSFVPHRPYYPFTVNLMTTALCYTDCIYCYAKRTLRPLLSAKEIIEILHDVKANGVVNVSLTGGDLFMLPDWDKVIEALQDLGYNSFISTKKPLASDELRRLISLGHNSFQFSLDSVNHETLTKLLKVRSDYLGKVDDMLTLCDEYGVGVQIRSVLTGINCNEQEIRELYEFLSKHPSITEWDITPVFLSANRPDYEIYKVSKEALKIAFDVVNSLDIAFPYAFNRMTDNEYKLKICKDVESFVDCNQICMANSYGMSILANGKCTVCEMLYDNQEYLIGDIRENKIYDIWNSERALELFSPNQKLIQKESPCYDCKVFDACKKSLKKRICYSDIAKINVDKLNTRDLPDPRCPKAPETEYIL